MNTTTRPPLVSRVFLFARFSSFPCSNRSLDFPRLGTSLHSSQALRTLAMELEGALFTALDELAARPGMASCPS